MNLLEKLWVIVSVSIIFIILSTDPKSSITGTWNNQLSTVFASTSDGQKFIKNLNWLLIIIFLLLTVSLSYFV